jgi:hypothetical protein
MNEGEHTFLRGSDETPCHIADATPALLWVAHGFGSIRTSLAARAELLYPAAGRLESSWIRVGLIPRFRRAPTH